LAADTRLRVAVDARTLQGQPGGVGRIVGNILPGIAAACEVHVLFDARLGSTLNAALPEGVERHALRAPLPGAAAWLQLAVPRFLRGFAGVFHCPFYGLPFRQRGPAVVTIHDLSFEDHPEWLPAGKRLAFQAQARGAARTAARILTDSAWGRERLVQRYGVDPSRVVSVLFNVDPRFEHLERVTGIAGRRPYVLAMGGAPRRNLPCAIAAVDLLRASGLDLDLVVVNGAPADAPPWVTDAGRPDDTGWAGLLDGASAFCYPTLYEGFGMPPLEALARRAPVVCARVGALPEVLADAAHWAAAPQPDAVAAALREVIEDSALASRLRERGTARLGRLPSWDAAATQHVQVYREALA
jgi:glycosyltransferase involved in cell wall biosynthesis